MDETSAGARHNNSKNAQSEDFLDFPAKFTDGLERSTSWENGSTGSAGTDGEEATGSSGASSTTSMAECGTRIAFRQHPHRAAAPWFPGGTAKAVRQEPHLKARIVVVMSAITPTGPRRGAPTRCLPGRHHGPPGDPPPQAREPRKASRFQPPPPARRCLPPGESRS